MQTVFGQGCVVQRFGDCNQAIFRSGATEESQTSFPTQGFIDLPESRRFGTSIAGFASSLAIVAPQQLVGNPARLNLGHTIFLFNEGSSIERVIPAFAQRIVEEHPQGLRPGFVAKAIGGRKSGNAQIVPRHIGDYWQGYAATCLRPWLASTWTCVVSPKYFVYTGAQTTVENFESMTAWRLTTRNTPLTFEDRG